MSMITATAWVPRGFASEFPTKYVFDDDEYSRIAQLSKLKLDDAREDLDRARDEEHDEDEGDSDDEGVKLGSGVNGVNSVADIDDDLKEYDLEHYDDEPDRNEDGDGDTMGVFGNIKSLVYHDANEEDPYVTLPEGDEDEEREELQILPTDNMVLAARIEDEVAHLEVYVYEDTEDNLYVHHDIMLPAIPLAVEWLDMPVGRGAVDTNGRGNYVAVGTMDPDIELWDLDVVDGMYPNAILGQGGEEAESEGKVKKKKPKKKSKKANDNYHVDAVLSLAANRQHRNLLASASADKTIKLWDLNSTKCAKSYTYHTDKVCSVSWNPQEPAVLLSGSYDRTAVAADMRAPDAKAPRWGVESDVESVRWDPHNPHLLYITTETGIVHHHDARNAPATPADSRPIWTLQAHSSPVTTFDVNPVIPGFLVTGSTDKAVKLWNVTPDGPSMVVSRDLGIGKVFSTTFAPDKEVGFRLAVAGSKGSVQIWDTSTNAAVRKAFATRFPAMEREVKERLVGLQEGKSDSEEGESVADDDENGEKDGWESMEE